jgi:hypothetical protein
LKSQNWSVALSGCAWLRGGKRKGDFTMRVVHSRDLTADEFTDISARYWPFDNFDEFWTGFADYQTDCNRRNRWPNSDAGEAWDRGTEAAMRVHWERYRCMYARDCLDTRAMCRGLRAGLKKRKAAAAVADDNEISAS